LHSEKIDQLGKNAKPCHIRKFGRNWEEVVEGRQGCTVLWGKIRLPQTAPSNGNRTEEATGREDSLAGVGRVLGPLRGCPGSSSG